MYQLSRNNHVSNLIQPRNARGRGPDQQPCDLEQGICRSCRAQSSVCAGDGRGLLGRPGVGWTDDWSGCSGATAG